MPSKLDLWHSHGHNTGAYHSLHEPIMNSCICYNQIWCFMRDKEAIPENRHLMLDHEIRNRQPMSATSVCVCSRKAGFSVAQQIGKAGRMKMYLAMVARWKGFRMGIIINMLVLSTYLCILYLCTQLWHACVGAGIGSCHRYNLLNAIYPI